MNCWFSLTRRSHHFNLKMISVQIKHLFSMLLLAIPSFSMARCTTLSFPLKPYLIHEFPLATYVNSIAVRERDGDMMVSVATTPEIFLISTDNEFEPIKVATIPRVEAAISITETSVDEFYIVAGNLSVTAKVATPGSFSVWKLDIKNGPHSVQPTKVADIKDGALLNRITSLDSETLLVSDSTLGVVWSINTMSGESCVILNDTATMAPRTPPGVGINYMSVYGDYLYYDNSEKGEISRIPIDLQNGTALGPAQVLVQNNETIFPEGFTIRKDNLWLANAAYSQLNFLPAAAAAATTRSSSPPPIQVVAGNPNDTVFAGPSDCKFGKKALDVERGSLYVTTVGKSGGNWTFGGSLWRLDVGPYLS